MTESTGNKRKVIKRGGSYTITIPAAYVAQLGITDGDIMEVDTNGREVILRVARRRDE